MIFTAAAVVDELIQMRGLRFHYRDWLSERAEAPTLVLLHGLTNHARSWDVFAAAMTDRYRVLALDQRGHGETEWAPGGRYGVEEMAEDLRAFVGALGLKRFTLVGASMGGRVAMSYSGNRPVELEALMLVDRGPEITESGASRVQSGLSSQATFASRDDAFAAVRANNTRPPEDIHRHRLDCSLQLTEEGRWTWRYDPALRTQDSIIRDTEQAWRDCANIAVPTHILRGEFSDILSQDIVDRMIDVIPNSTMSVVCGAGHPIPLDTPDHFLSAAREFLKQ